jgi:phosphatidate cytidylyltransferase
MTESPPVSPLISPDINTAWSPGAQLALLFAVLCSGLLAAVLASVVLRRWRGDTAAADRIDATTQRWSGLLALLMLGAIAGNAAIIVAAAALSFQSLREFFSLIHTRRADHWALLAAFFVALPAQYLLIAVNWYGLFAILLPVYAFLLMPVIPALRGDTTRYMDRIAEVQWGLMISVYCLSHVPALLLLDIPGFGGRQALLIIVLILVSQGADLVRTEVARRRPTAAILASIGAGGLLCLLLSPLSRFPPLLALALGFVIAAMGAAGRLVLTAIKHDRGIADWRQGHGGHSGSEATGGLLDRLDTLIFAAPVYFHLTRFLLTTP